MATEILATGSGAATSSDVVVSGSPLTVALKGMSGTQPARVNIELYNGATYELVGSLNQDNRALVVSAAGTYRFVRVTGTCGVFSG